MKKLLLIAAASAMCLAASAQAVTPTVIAPISAADAETAGYAALWGSYTYGYVLPNGYVSVDNDEIKVTVDNGSSDKPGANVSYTGLNTSLFPCSFNMGSSVNDPSLDGVYSLAGLSNGIKQPYAIFTVEAKQNGSLTMYTNRGGSKYTIFVYDCTDIADGGEGAYVMASTIQPGEAGNGLVSISQLGLLAGHKYWIFGSGNGANINMYQMVFTPCGAESYSLAAYDAAKFTTSVTPMGAADAETAGYAALWGSYTYGYVLPNGYVSVDNDEIKVTVDNGSSDKPGANVSYTGLNTSLFPCSFNMGSSVNDPSLDGVYSLAGLSNGIKQPYAIFTVEAKENGSLTMYTNRGGSKYTIFVYDCTDIAEGGEGAYVMASTIQPGDAGNGLVSTSQLGLLAGHKYWVFGSGNGANINMYALGFTKCGAASYGYTGDSQVGIADVIVDVEAQSDAIYNVYGQRVDENYKGIVIKNGKKYLQK